MLHGLLIFIIGIICLYWFCDVKLVGKKLENGEQWLKGCIGLLIILMLGDVFEDKKEYIIPKTEYGNYSPANYIVSGDHSTLNHTNVTNTIKTSNNRNDFCPPDKSHHPKYAEYVEEAANKYGVCSRLINAIIGSESNFKVRAKSHANAKGLMQVVPKYHVGNGKTCGKIDIYDPRLNILCGTKILKIALVWADKQYGSKPEKQSLALMLGFGEYNAGRGNAKRFLEICQKETCPYAIKNAAKFNLHINLQSPKISQPDKGLVWAKSAVWLAAWTTQGYLLEKNNFREFDEIKSRYFVVRVNGNESQVVADLKELIDKKYVTINNIGNGKIKVSIHKNSAQQYLKQFKVIEV